MAKEKSKRSKRRAKRIPGGVPPPGRAMPPIGEMSEFEEAVNAASAKGKQLLRERIDQRSDALEASIRESENQGWNERNPGTHIIWDKLGQDDA